MEGDLGFTLERWYDKARLHREFEFETMRPLDECVHNLRLLQPVQDDWSWGSPRAHREVIISQFDDHSADFTVNQRRRGGKRRHGYRTTAIIQGRLERNLETGRVWVTGNASIDSMSLVGIAIVIPVILLFIFGFGFPSWVLVVMIAALGYACYSLYQDHTDLLRAMEEALR